MEPPSLKRGMARDETRRALLRAPPARRPAAHRRRRSAGLAEAPRQDGARGLVMLLPEYWSTCKDAVFAALEKATEGKDS